MNNSQPRGLEDPNQDVKRTETHILIRKASEIISARRLELTAGMTFEVQRELKILNITAELVTFASQASLGHNDFQRVKFEEYFKSFSELEDFIWHADQGFIDDLLPIIQELIERIIVKLKEKSTILNKQLQSVQNMEATFLELKALLELNPDLDEES